MDVIGDGLHDGREAVDRPGDEDDVINGCLQGDRVENAVEDVTAVTAAILNAIQRGDDAAILAVFADPRLESAVCDAAWDLVAPLCASVRDAATIGRAAAAATLVRLAGVGNAKELLLGLLEQADERSGGDAVFLSLLPPTLICLRRLPVERRAASLGVALETLSAHLATLPHPDDDDDGDDDDGDVQRVVVCVDAWLDFLRPLADDVSWTKTSRWAQTTPTDSAAADDDGSAAPDRNASCMTRQRRSLSDGLLRTLSDCLAFLDLSPATAVTDGPLRRTGRTSAESLMDIAAVLHVDFDHALVTMGERCEKEEFGPLRRGVAVFAYLALAERLQADRLPSVLSARHHLLAAMPSVNRLLDEPSVAVQRKGVATAGALLSRLIQGALHVDFLDDAATSRMIDGLLRTAMHGALQPVRRDALAAIETLRDRLTPDGRARLIHRLLTDRAHAGVAAYATGKLKDEIHAGDDADAPQRPARLAALLRLALWLPEGATSDLLEQSDRVMAALNLLRYVALRAGRPDGAAAAAAVWTRVRPDAARYVATIRTGVDMSQAHYQAEAAGGEGEAGDVGEVGVSVGGLPLPALDGAQKAEMLAAALTMFDMMRSVLVRVEELVEMTPRDVR